MMSDEKPKVEQQEMKQNSFVFDRIFSIKLNNERQLK